MNPFYRFPASQRPLRIETPLGADTFALLELTGHECLSELYEFQLRLAADRYTTIDFGKLLGKCVTLRINTPELGERIIHGMMCALTQLHNDDTLTHFDATIVPLFWLWNQRRQSRCFQQMSTPDILKAVYDGLETKFLLSGQYLARDYCVQYDETDFAFATRLMQEDGFFYYFEHRADGHTLVITDDVANLAAPTLLDTVLFDADLGGTVDFPRVYKWSKSQKLVTTKFTCWDQCFEMPTQNFEADTEITTDIQCGTVSHKFKNRDEDLEAYVYPGQMAKWFDGVAPGGGDRAADLQHIFSEKDRRVRLQSEAAAASAIRCDGTSNLLRLLPGVRFALAGHGWGDGKYLLVRIEHAAQMRIPTRSNEDIVNFSYENRFTALPDGQAFRLPSLPAKPRIVGLQTALVTGPTGQEVFVDKYGRIKIQFPWDRQGQKNADSSCWVRVAQALAGNRFGAFYWPRIGHEVVVAFEDGDPDRPLIVGSVYNAANMPPLELPEDVQITGFKSCIYGGNPLAKFNALMFHDIPGREYVHVHSETHSMQNSESDHFEYVPDSHYSFHGSL